MTVTDKTLILITTMSVHHSCTLALWISLCCFINITYVLGQTSFELSVSMTSESMDSNQPKIQSEMRPRVMGVILSIASCLIITTNLLVAAALLKLLLKKSSQSWCFVLNLALADALVGVAITGLATEDFNSNITEQQRGHVTTDLPTNATPSAPHGKTRCLMRMAFVTSPCTASIMSMFLISLDRYAAIKMPLRYSLLSGKGTAVGSLLILWISSLTMGFLPVMVRQLQARRRYDGFCAFFSVIHDVGMIVLYSACFFPVLSLFIYMYLDILKIACSHQRQICRVRQASTGIADQHDHQHYQHHRQQQQLRSWSWGHVKALRTVAMLVGCFLVLWSPFFVVCIVHILCKTCELKAVLENHLWLLGLSNSLINPVVYAFCQTEVRLQIAAMFSCITGRSLTTGPPGVTERCDVRQDTLNPIPLQPITSCEAQAGHDLPQPVCERNCETRETVSDCD